MEQRLNPRDFHLELNRLCSGFLLLLVLFLFLLFFFLILNSRLNTLQDQAFPYFLLSQFPVLLAFTCYVRSLLVPGATPGAPLPLFPLDADDDTPVYAQASAEQFVGLFFMNFM